MSEIDEIRSRLSTLENSLTVSERSRRKLLTQQRWIVVAAFVVVLMALVAIPVVSSSAPSILTCRGINVVDGSGKILLALGSNDHGGVLTLCNSDGKPRVKTQVGNIGQGEILAIGKNDTVLTNISADLDGSALRVCGYDGNTRVLIACQTGAPNAGLINIRDYHGKERVNIGSDFNGGQITVGNDGEKIMSRLGTDARGGNLYLYGQDHRAHIVMANGDGNVGIINTRDGEGQNRVILGYDKDGGQVVINGTDGKPRAGLLVGEAESGIVSLFDKSGNLLK